MIEVANLGGESVGNMENSLAVCIGLHIMYALVGMV